MDNDFFGIDPTKLDIYDLAKTQKGRQVLRVYRHDLPEDRVCWLVPVLMTELDHIERGDEYYICNICRREEWATEWGDGLPYGWQTRKGGGTPEIELHFCKECAEKYGKSEPRPMPQGRRAADAVCQLGNNGVGIPSPKGDESRPTLNDGPTLSAMGG